MRDLERTWNRKFNYPWLFLNDEPFTEEFKKAIRGATKAEVKFGRQRVTTKEFEANKYRRTRATGTLGNPKLDQRRSVQRIRQSPERARSAIHG
jgi:hypothetical protein